jgi:hypothetical protein
LLVCPCCRCWIIEDPAAKAIKEKLNQLEAELSKHR